MFINTMSINSNMDYIIYLYSTKFTPSISFVCAIFYQSNELKEKTNIFMDANY